MLNLKLSLNEIVECTKGNLLYKKDIASGTSSSSFTSFVTDSRKVVAGSIFLCIKGAQVDGHDFIEDVQNAGASLIIGSDEKKLKSLSNAHCSILLVEEPLSALHSIATHYRKKFNIPVIALTGSVGKTTTKDMMGSILKNAVSGENQVLVTPGTLNNHWGVPFTVMDLKEDNKAAVFECGINHFGEMLPLVSICQPTIGLITNIGKAHLEALKDQNGVLKEKGVLFKWIIEATKTDVSRRTLVFNIDDPFLKQFLIELQNNSLEQAKQNKVQVLTVSMVDSSADVFLEQAEFLFGKTMGWEYRIRFPGGTASGLLTLLGKHNLLNLLLAVAATYATGLVDEQAIAKGAADVKLSKFRSDFVQVSENVFLLDDSYNANPTSFEALFQTAHDIKTAVKNLTVIGAVSDMKELGPDAKSAHEKMAARAKELKINHLYATGEFANDWVRGFGQGSYEFKSKEQLLEKLSEFLKQEKSQKILVIVKGSRSTQMDFVSGALKRGG